jgi:hypothetical protein
MPTVGHPTMGVRDGRCGRPRPRLVSAASPAPSLRLACCTATAGGAGVRGRATWKLHCTEVGRREWWVVMLKLYLPAPDS